MSMEWSKLIKPLRLACPPGSINGQEEARSEYQRDCDRIIFSNAFRRLAGKTQVFPLPESDMTHTRLTHSLEASCVGRSLGTIAGSRLEMGGNSPETIGAIVAAASLAHDIGNPPLGHSGEEAISHFFKEGEGKVYVNQLNPIQRCDLENFEGNAAGFRIMTNMKPFQTENPGGLSLTLPTLAAYTKYPRQSYVKTPDLSRVSEKKFSIFYDGLSNFVEIADGLGIDQKPSDRGWFRHPLAFLTEAADDICFLIMDLEDAYRLKIVEFNTVYDFLKSICDQFGGKDYLKNIDKIKAEDQRIGYLRAKTINSLIWQVAGVYEEKDKEIRDGQFDKPLLDEIALMGELDEIRKFSVKNIYSHKKVAAIEAAGYEVLCGLLESFLEATVGNPRTTRSKKTRSLIPREYLDENREPFSDRYQTIMNITEFISGMTDTYAIDTYRVLKGISLPNYSP